MEASLYKKINPHDSETLVYMKDLSSHNCNNLASYSLSSFSKGLNEPIIFHHLLKPFLQK